MIYVTQKKPGCYWLKTFYYYNYNYYFMLDCELDWMFQAKSQDFKLTNTQRLHTSYEQKIGIKRLGFWCKRCRLEG